MTPGKAPLTYKVNGKNIGTTKQLLESGLFALFHTSEPPFPIRRLRYWHNLWHLHSSTCCPMDHSKGHLISAHMTYRPNSIFFFIRLFTNYILTADMPLDWRHLPVSIPLKELFFFCSVIFQSIDSKPAINKKEKVREWQQYNKWLKCTSWRNASVPIALLILAQISIACKELLISLKQAILIKARIINSDLQTPWPLKIEERFGSKWGWSWKQIKR